MSQAFGKMNMSLGKNLNIVNKHIQNLLDGNSSDEQDEPKLESLSQILSAIQIQLKQSFLVQMVNQKKKILQQKSPAEAAGNGGAGNSEPAGAAAGAVSKNKEVGE